MPLTLLLGGASSGKSGLAVRLASGWAGSVVVIATAEPRDDEMRARIQRHRSGRPREWGTVEESLELGSALSSAPVQACVVVECLTLWVSNLIEAQLPDARIEDTVRECARLASGRRSPVIAVSNEVGSGIVPANALSRRYRDLLGTANAIWAEAADRVALVVAGRPVPLPEPGAWHGIAGDG